MVNEGQCVWSQTQRDPHVTRQWHIYVFFSAFTLKTGNSCLLNVFLINNLFPCLWFVQIEKDSVCWFTKWFWLPTFLSNTWREYFLTRSKKNSYSRRCSRILAFNFCVWDHAWAALVICFLSCLEMLCAQRLWPTKTWSTVNGAESYCNLKGTLFR